jgi:hypothetical protein
MFVDTFVVRQTALTFLDQLRDEGTASATVILNNRLSRMHFEVQRGHKARIECETGAVLLSDPADFKNWCLARYPHASLSEWPS